LYCLSTTFSDAFGISHDAVVDELGRFSRETLGEIGIDIFEDAGNKTYILSKDACWFLYSHLNVPCNSVDVLGFILVLRHQAKKGFCEFVKERFINDIGTPCKKPASFLYVIKCNDIYKIGESASPEERLKTFKTGHYETLELVFTKETTMPKKLEHKVHELLSEHHVNGE
jgi:Meiotically up-regulated gene 113